MRISDWSSDVCSSDLLVGWDNDFVAELLLARAKTYARDPCRGPHTVTKHLLGRPRQTVKRLRQVARYFCPRLALGLRWALTSRETRSEEHTSELQSLMRISYAVFCLKKKTTNKQTTT